MWHLSEYEKLVASAPGDERKSASHTPRAGQRAYKRLGATVVALLVITAGFLLVGFGLLRSFPIPDTGEELIPHCGHSPDEARSRGCHYEPLMTSWMHPLCFFQEVVDLYEDIYDKWAWYHDPGLTKPINHPHELDSLRAGNYSLVFTSGSNAHEVHCLYTWRKLNFAMQHNRTWIDARALEYSHSDHCAAAVTETIRSATDSVSLLREESHSHKDSFGGKRNPNATVWPMGFHPCVPLQHFPPKRR